MSGSTWRQDPKATHRDLRETPAPAVRKGDKDSPAPTLRDDSANQHEYGSILRLPTALAANWHIVRELDSRGAEADLLIVANAANERRVAKIYRAGLQPKTDVLQRVGGTSFEHVVRLYDHGRSDGRWFELVEYIENGSLADLLRREGPKLPEMRIGQVLVELLKAIQHLHAGGVVHRDLKPGNILVRSLKPFDLVIADFGIASVLGDNSKRFTSGHRTIAYASPEAAAGEISKASDWWSLGIMLVEMLTGRHPFAAAELGELLDERVIMSRLAQMPVDDLVDGISGPWPILCRGLLRREAKNRWTDIEIVKWIRRDPDLKVVEEAAQPTAQPSQFYFVGGRYSNLPEIARAFAANWIDARKTIERGHFLNWVKDDLKDNEWHQFLLDLDRDCGDLDERVFRIIIKLDPSAVPTFRGYRLDPDGLNSLAKEAIADEAMAHSVLAAIFGRQILTIAAEETGIAQLRQLDEQLRAMLREYKNVKNATILAGGSVSDQANKLGFTREARFLLTALPGGKSYLSGLRREASEQAAPDAGECPWFKALGDPQQTTAPIALLMIASAPAAKLQAAEERKRKAAHENEQRKLRQWPSMRRKIVLFSSGFGLVLGMVMSAMRIFIGNQAAGWSLSSAFKSIWDHAGHGETLLLLPIVSLMLTGVAVFILVTIAISHAKAVNRLLPGD